MFREGGKEGDRAAGAEVEEENLETDLGPA